MANRTAHRPRSSGTPVTYPKPPQPGDKGSTVSGVDVNAAKNSRVTRPIPINLEISGRSADSDYQEADDEIVANFVNKLIDSTPHSLAPIYSKVSSKSGSEDSSDQHADGARKTIYSDSTVGSDSGSDSSVGSDSDSDSASDSGFSSDSDDANPITNLQVVLKKNFVEKIQSAIGTILPNPTPKTRRVVKDFNIFLRKFIQEANALQSKLQPEPLSAIREQLRNREAIMLELNRAVHSRPSSSQVMQSGGLTLDQISKILEGMDKAHEALKKFNRPTDECRTQLNQCIADIRLLRKEIAKPANNDMSSLKAQAYSELTLQLKALIQLNLKLSKYNSPHSGQNRLKENKLHADAAHAVFQSLLDDVPDNIKGSNSAARSAFDEDARFLQDILKSRSDILLNAIQKKTFPIFQDAAPAGAQPSKLVNRVVEIMQKHQLKIQQTGLSDILPEKKLMADLIDAFLQAYPAADTRSGKRLLDLAKNWVLSQQSDWKVIKSKVLIPIQGTVDIKESIKIPAVTLVKIETVTTPVGHVFNNGKIVVDSDNSPLTSKSFEAYRTSDPDNPHQKITTGRNSRSTIEHMHGVNVARTESFLAGKQLFGGTRHGTLSAYDLYPGTLRAKSDKRLDAMAEDLMNHDTHITRIYSSLAAARDTPDTQENSRQPTELDMQWEGAMKSVKSKAAFMQKARTDEKFCELLRRKVALNRAREVFLSEVLGNPTLQEKIQDGKKIHFNAISLITPDPFRNFLAKLMPSTFRKNDELTMRREEMQAWKDLQSEIEGDGLVIDGKFVVAEIHSFSMGVSQMAQDPGNRLTRALTSGWNMVAEENRLAMIDMIGDPALVKTGDENSPRGIQYTFGGQLGNIIQERTKAIANQALKIKNFQHDLSNINSKMARLGNISPIKKKFAIQQQNALKTFQAERAKIGKFIEEAEKHQAAEKLRLVELKELGIQLAEMWQSGQYRHAGDQPYKFAARLALLSSRMNGGTAFNCKNGITHTAQLDLEIKLLAVQCEGRRNHPDQNSTGTQLQQQTVPPPYVGRTDFEKHQLQAFIFQDESRTVMQRYNTGVEGSNLDYWEALYNSFTLPGVDADWVETEFRGRSDLVRA